MNLDLVAGWLQRHQLLGGCVASSVKNGRDRKNAVVGCFTHQLEELAKMTEIVRFMKDVLSMTKNIKYIIILGEANVLQVRYLNFECYNSKYHTIQKIN